MLERFRERLRNLNADRCAGIERQSMVLAVDERELRLQEQLFARDAARRDARADAGLEVVLALIRGVDAAKSRGERVAHAAFGVVLFPRGAVEPAERHARSYILRNPFALLRAPEKPGLASNERTSRRRGLRRCARSEAPAFAVSAR